MRRIRRGVPIAPRVRELPLRTRRIRKPPRRKTNQDGTTSACAENTWLPPCLKPRPRNYLRVRGEYMTAVQAVGPAEELPPRTRRIPYFGRRNWKKLGTTSAHSENTGSPCIGGCYRGNYLRARGEYVAWTILSARSPELPPRTRRILPTERHNPEPGGTTSAHAENTRVRVPIGVP